MEQLKLHPLWRFRWLFVLDLVLLVAGLLSWTLWTLTLRFQYSIFHAPEYVPQRRVAIVFGAGYWPDGRLSHVLQDRLDSAIELYRAGRVEVLLFSGDNRFANYNEPERMLQYALEQGMPREAIVLDYAGRRTYDTCYRARDIFQVQQVVLVTNRYHLPRALETCQALGLDAVGYAADRQPYIRRYIAWYWFRELPAIWRGWWDLYITQPKPVLGEPLPIFPADG